MSARLTTMMTGWLVLASGSGGAAADLVFPTDGAVIQLSEQVTASAVCGKGIHVAVHRTNILTSPDKIHWTARDSGSVSRLHGAAFGNGRFVVVGNEGVIINSEDGIHWARQDSGSSADFLRVSCTNGVFLVTDKSLVQQLMSLDQKASASR